MRTSVRVIFLRVLRFPVLLAGLAVAVFSAGCTTIAQVANLTEAQCNASFESQLTSILTEQGEKDEVAATLTHGTYLMLTAAEMGPRPFLVASPSGTDYTFFIQKKRNHCLPSSLRSPEGFCVLHEQPHVHLHSRTLRLRLPRVGCAMADCEVAPAERSQWAHVFDG
jgi:hypothetical protein